MLLDFPPTIAPALPSRKPASISSAPSPCSPMPSAPPSTKSITPLNDWQIITNKFQKLALDHPLAARVVLGGLGSMLDRLNGCFEAAARD